MLRRNHHQHLLHLLPYSLTPRPACPSRPSRRSRVRGATRRRQAHDARDRVALGSGAVVRAAAARAAAPNRGPHQLLLIFLFLLPLAHRVSDAARSQQPESAAATAAALGRGDWYYIRAAAIARRVYLRNGIGVGAFKRIFGGRRMRGTIPERFQSSSGSIARHILKEVRSRRPSSRS